MEGIFFLFLDILLLSCPCIGEIEFFYNQLILFLGVVRALQFDLFVDKVPPEVNALAVKLGVVSKRLAESLVDSGHFLLVDFASWDNFENLTLPRLSCRC